MLLTLRSTNRPVCKAKATLDYPQSFQSPGFRRGSIQTRKWCIIDNGFADQAAKDPTLDHGEAFWERHPCWLALYKQREQCNSTLVQFHRKVSHFCRATAAPVVATAQLTIQHVDYLQLPREQFRMLANDSWVRIPELDKPLDVCNARTVRSATLDTFWLLRPGWLIRLDVPYLN